MRLFIPRLFKDPVQCYSDYINTYVFLNYKVFSTFKIYVTILNNFVTANLVKASPSILFPS